MRLWDLKMTCLTASHFWISADYKVFGRLASDIPETEIKVGMEMKVVPNELPNGQLNYVFQKA